MARTADHAARRDEILRAVREVLVREGLERVTVARVALQAGISVGLVQHYYRSKKAMLADAHRRTIDEIEQRADSSIAEDDRNGTRIEHTLAAALHQLLPLDVTRRTEWLIDRSFRAAALSDPEIRRVILAADSRLRSRVAGAISNGIACGEVAPDTDPARAALSLLTHVMALADHLAWKNGTTKADAHAIINADCATIFAGECTQRQP